MSLCLGFGDRARDTDDLDIGFPGEDLGKRSGEELVVVDE
jgi:hypothetical protein